MKTFNITHSEKTNAARTTIWNFWSDINNWPQWDAGLTACRTTTEFKEGNSFELTPRGAPGAVTATLEVVIPNVKFTDKTNLGFATLEAIHEMTEVENELIITHTIIINVQDEQAAFFETQMLPGLKYGLPHSVKSLAIMAEQYEADLPRNRISANV